MPPHAWSTQQPDMPPHAPAARPSNYCPIPQRLPADLHDTPLAVGLYALIGRLFLILGEAVPLSVGDVRAYDPRASESAVWRAFQRLIRCGWLQETKARGRKSRYVPTWGRCRGETRPWVVGDPTLGRPRHVHRLPLDRALLDTCMGKLTPHATRAATITRYLSEPVLSLVDVGSAALTLADIVRPTPALLALGAVRGGEARCLPPTPELLARLSQPPLALDGESALPAVSLTPVGLRRLGLAAPMGTPALSTGAQPLVFVSNASFGIPAGIPSGNSFGNSASCALAFAASEPGELPHAPPSDMITWDMSETSKTSDSPPTPHTGGGAVCSGKRNDQEPRATRQGAPIPAAPTIPDTAATRLLQTIHVHPEQQIELAHLSADTVATAIADGRARPGVRDLAGWVVHLLRAGRDYGWRMPPPAARADSAEALGAFFAQYKAEQETESHAALSDPVTIVAPPQPCASEAQLGFLSAGPSDMLPADSVQRSVGFVSASGACDDLGQEPLRAHTTPALAPAQSPGAVWAEVQTALRMRLPRADYQAVIAPATLRALADDVATIAVPRADSKARIEMQYRRAVLLALAEVLGRPVTVRVVLASPGTRR